MGTLLKDKIFSVNNETGSINKDPIKNWLITNYNKVVFRPDQRTLIYNGYPYGTAYQYGDAHTNGDVFGNVLSHSIDNGVTNAVVMGNSNQASYNNSLALGSYNLSKSNNNSYIFSIGNGEDSTNRSNLMMVDTKGNVTSYSISNTKLDTSYVTTLGPKANLNDTLSALLDEAKYYKPTIDDFTLDVNDHTVEYDINTTIPPKEVILTWNKNKPFYKTTYIYTYINNNSKLPNNVSLSQLGYTSAILSGTFSSGVFYDKYTSPILDEISWTDSDTQLVPIYGGTTSPYKFVIHKNTSKPIDTPQLGYYDLVKDLTITINYDKSQISYYSQLANKDIFVISDKNKFDSGSFSINSLNHRIWVGTKFVAGIFTSDTNYNFTIVTGSPDVNDFCNEAKLNSITPLNDSYHVKGCTLITGLHWNEIVSTGNPNIKFNNKMFGMSSNQHELYTPKTYKYIYFGCPTILATDAKGTFNWKIQKENDNVNSIFHTNYNNNEYDSNNYRFTYFNYDWIVAKTTSDFNVTSYCGSNCDGASLTLNNVTFASSNLLFQNNINIQ